MPLLLFGIMPAILGGSFALGHFYPSESEISIVGPVASDQSSPNDTEASGVSETFDLAQDLMTGSGAYIRLSDDQTEYEWTRTDGITGSIAVDRMGFTDDPSNTPSLTCTTYPNDLVQCVYTGPTDMLSVEAIAQ